MKHAIISSDVLCSIESTMVCTTHKNVIGEQESASEKDSGRRLGSGAQKVEFFNGDIFSWDPGGSIGHGSKRVALAYRSLNRRLSGRSKT